MKHFLIALALAVATATVPVGEADAKRLGGGGSFGKQSQNINRPAPAYTPGQNTAAPRQAPAPAPGAVPQRQPNRWGGMLGGALAGLGLGMLFSHLGIGGAFGGILGGLLTIVLIIAAASILFRMLRRKQEAQPVLATAGGPMGAQGATPEIGSRLDQGMQRRADGPGAGAAAVAGTVVPAWGIPSDFDTDGFLRHAKSHFIRLQAAWDRADVEDLREFTTPETFAELRMQLQERGPSPNHTDVVQLDAELLGIETLGDSWLASVRFTGLVSEAAGASPAPFAEVWNLSKPASGQGGWVLAGIQQAH